MKPGLDQILRPCVIIPAYNAHATIGPLVRRLRARALDVVVVDDGSTDRTACDAIEAGAIVLSRFRNEGKGAALRLGFAYAGRQGYDAVVTMDGDGQHDPDDLPRLLAAARQAPQALVIGQRTIEPRHSPRLTRWANCVMSSLVSRLARHHIPDPQCGFRIIRRQTLAAMTLSSRRFDIDAEMLLGAARQGWQVLSVPIRTIDDHRVSRIRPIRDSARFLGVILRYLFLPAPTRRWSAEPAG